MADKLVTLQDENKTPIYPETKAKVVKISSGKTVEELIGSGIVPEAPKDGKTYGRNNSTWVETSQMDEAPSDGNAYARKNKGWAKVIESTETALLDNYVKSDSYTAIEPTDSINSAIGKLEAGLDSLQGGGSETDNVFYLPYAIYSLKSGATKSEIETALGGSEGIAAMKAAMGAQKEIRIKGSNAIIMAINTPVSYELVLNGSSWGLYFNEGFYGTARNSYAKKIYITSNSVKILYLGGYGIKSEFYSLTSESTTDDISIALGGESGFKNIIQAIKDGNKLYIEGNIDTHILRTDLLVNIYAESENGDITLLVFGAGYGLWGGLGMSMMTIQYTKSSNTFSASVTALQ